MPLTAGLQEAMDHISLEDRLEWHAALCEANARMAAAAAAAANRRSSPGSAGERWPPKQQQLAVYGSSALSPATLRQALLGGGPRDLALSDKVAAVVVANELDVPLHGLELDEPDAYAALLSGGPLLSGGRSSSRSSMEEVGPARSRDGADAGASSAGAGTAHEARQLGRRQQQQQQEAADAEAEAQKLAAAQEALVWQHVAEHRPELAVAFRGWMDAAAAQLLAGADDGGGSGPLLAQKLVVSSLSGLMPQCLPPGPHRRLTAATDRLFMGWSAAGAAGPAGPTGGGELPLAAAAARQYVKLTTLREAHFLERLRAIATSGGHGGRRCKRVLAVVGRSHADHLLTSSQRH
ncbi:hypothetical protein HYH02_010560 [Chlamydomonas schloesseri]|uniref:Uncharacterized protein n=1 Tax=Chlamydomonas schloesseri TaxID=2026947 RepID=A0A835W761_9CHLO|nr:hypothetical protein HYH02_010560 [Chlamydomonas schloesseri]|eukprot:KAG2439679.1 hypothetical protein HYH02_010560 [Chlamydomonas schloesseri]